MYTGIRVWQMYSLYTGPSMQLQCLQETCLCTEHHAKWRQCIQDRVIGCKSSKFVIRQKHPKNDEWIGIRKRVHGLMWSIVTNPLSRTVSAIRRVIGRKRVFYLPHPCSFPNLTKLPFQFSDDVIGSIRSGRRTTLLKCEIYNTIRLSQRMRSQSNPCTNVTDGQTDDTR